MLGNECLFQVILSVYNDFSHHC